MISVPLAAVSESAALGAVAASALGSAAIIWWRLQKSIRLIREQTEVQMASLELSHKAQKEGLERQLEDAVESKTELKTALETAHRDAACAANEAREALQLSQAVLAEARAQVAQIPSLESAISSLQETHAALQSALSAEKGRATALEQALAQATRRADNLDTRLQEEESARAKLEIELMQERQSATLERERRGGADHELAALRANHEDYRQQAETRIANLQRQLTAAEARAALVQKEFMSAVGVTPAASSVAASSVEDRRVRELEQRIAQIEAEARKRAREDGYKIAEFEFRLAEARDELARVKIEKADPDIGRKTDASSSQDEVCSPIEAEQGMNTQVQTSTVPEPPASTEEL